MRLLDECLQVLRPEAQALIGQRYGERRTVESLAMALGRIASAVSGARAVNLFAIRKKLRECIEAKATALFRGGL